MASYSVSFPMPLSHIQAFKVTNSAFTLGRKLSSQFHHSACLNAPLGGQIEERTNIE